MQRKKRRKRKKTTARKTTWEDGTATHLWNSMKPRGRTSMKMIGIYVLILVGLAVVTIAPT